MYPDESSPLSIALPLTFSLYVCLSSVAASCLRIMQSLFLLLLLGAAGIQSQRTGGSSPARQPSNSTRYRGTSQCPQVWNRISSDLTRSFVSGGECTDLARAAIRYAFHDAGTFSTKLPNVSPASGGADGSLLLNDEEINRDSNRGLQNYHSFIRGIFAEYGSDRIGAADLVQFAGNHAVVSCPEGPIVPTLIGREDSSTPAPEGLLPAGFGSGSDHDTILQLFADKGFSALDLAALLGAHSTSKSRSDQLPPNTGQDSTPGIWDVKYYSEIYNPPPGVANFEADINLSSPNTTVGREFVKFINNQGRWNGNFASAMFRLSLLGIPPETFNTFVDCTGALPRPTRAGAGGGGGGGGRGGGRGGRRGRNN